MQKCEKKYEIAFCQSKGNRISLHQRRVRTINMPKYAMQIGGLWREL